MTIRHKNQIQVTVNLSIDRIKELLTQLSAKELNLILTDLKSRRETAQMMKLAESGFAEWNTEEDLYGE